MFKEPGVGDKRPEGEAPPPMAGSAGRLYDAEYYAHYDDHEGKESTPYVRGEPWLGLFASFADRIVRDVEPGSVLDVGCAIGLLVEALRDRGVDARGFDLSEFAIAQVGDGLRPYVWVGSLLDPIEGHFDLVTCLEVLEHIDDALVDRAVANLCAVTDDVIFSSTPDDWREETHVNVRPLEYWSELFARHGFVRDLSFDGSFIAWWAVRYRRRRDPWHRVVQVYEREVGRMSVEAHHRNQVLVEKMQEINRLRAAQGLSVEGMGLDVALDEAQSRELELLRRSEEMESALGDRDRALQGIMGSRSYRVASELSRMARAAAPPGSRRARVAHLSPDGDGRSTAGTGGPDTASAAADEWELSAAYLRWLARHRPSPGELLRLRARSRQWKERPLISVIMPVHDPRLSWLEAAVKSVVDQTYDRWELCIADDGSTAQEVPELLNQLAASEPRIKLMIREEQGGISAASNSALTLASGDFISFLDHDDVIEPHALQLLAERLEKEPGLDLIYSDEDKLSSQGRRIKPFFKPDWSPELLLALNYITHMVLIRRSLVERVGGLRSEMDGAQDYDLFLRCVEASSGIAHVPSVLYSWRQVPGSAASSTSDKPWAYTAGRRAVADALQRRGIEATVSDGATSGWYEVHRSLARQPGVTIVIPNRDHPHLLLRCLDSVRSHTSYPNCARVIVDKDSRVPETRRLLHGDDLRVVAARGASTHSRMVNQGVAAAESEFVVLLSSAAVVRSPGWLEALLEEAVAEGVAVVGARLVHPDGRPQHQGIAVSGAADGRPYNLQVPWDVLELIPSWPVAREVSAVTGSCMMVRSDVWRQLGGFDERFAATYADVDFCLRAAQLGHRVIYTPRAELTYEEGGNTPAHASPADDRQFEERWLSAGERSDPFLTPNVRWVDGRFRLA